MMKEKQLLRELIQIPSESGNEKEIGEYLYDLLKTEFNTEKQYLTDNFNLFAKIGEPKIILATHIDTVYGKIELKEEGGYVYGTGACDNKSQITAMIIAARMAIEKGIKDFGIMFTVQEETDFAGVKKIVGLIPASTELIVCGEPTDLKIINRQKGLMTLKLISKGKSAHGSKPETGVNSIELLIEDLIKIKSIIKNLDFETDHWKNSVNLGKINGGTAGNVVPDHAEAVIEIRNIIDSKIILQKIKQEIKSEIETINLYEPIINMEAKKVAKELNLELKSVPYFTEMYFYHDFAPTIVLGAGSEDDAHSNSERVKVSDVEKLAQIYFALIKTHTK
jgi:succinyl-diaminopimelate desuccinylase